MKRLKKKGQLLILVLVVGFLFGIIYENIAIQKSGVTIEIFQSYFLERFQNTSVISEAFLGYVIRLRLVSVLMIVLIGCLKWKKLGVSICVGWTGFLLGILMVSSIIQTGIRGLLICLAGMFPHMLFYLPAYVMIFAYFYDYPRKEWNWSKTIFVILTFFVGIVIEAYVNPMLMKLIVKIV